MTPSHVLTSCPVRTFRPVQFGFTDQKLESLKIIFSTTTHRPHTGTPSHNMKNTKHLYFIVGIIVATPFLEGEDATSQSRTTITH